METRVPAPYLKLSQDDCLDLLEEVLWNNQPICPYCGSHQHTQLINEHRYRCNSCHTAYSVTVKTIFHDTRLPLNKWFAAIYVLLIMNEETTARDLADGLSINKNTAWYLMKRIENGLLDTNNRQMIFSITEKLRGKYGQ
jgi:transposase-like protein